MPLFFYVVAIGLITVAIASFGSFGGMLIGVGKPILGELAKLTIAGLIVSFGGIGFALVGLLYRA